MSSANVLANMYHFNQSILLEGFLFIVKSAARRLATHSLGYTQIGSIDVEETNKCNLSYTHSLHRRIRHHRSRIVPHSSISPHV